MTLLTGETDLKKGAESHAKLGAVFILITLGHKGAFYSTPNHHRILPTYDVRTIDTTGAGDAFLGAVLYRLRGKAGQIATMDQDEIEDIVQFANAAGSLTTTRKGAIPAMPTLKEIELFQSKYNI